MSDYSLNPPPVHPSYAQRVAQAQSAGVGSRPQPSQGGIKPPPRTNPQFMHPTGVYPLVPHGSSASGSPPRMTMADSHTQQNSWMANGSEGGSTGM